MDAGVEQLIEDCGHVHDNLGGGATSSGQAGDTHRHGPLRGLVRDEEDNAFFKAPCAYKQSVPQPSRTDG